MSMWVGLKAYACALENSEECCCNVNVMYISIPVYFVETGEWEALSFGYQSVRR